MISSVFNTFFYNPLYNSLVFFITIVPFADVGLAIILLTVLVKLILFPISKKSVRTQFLMRKIEPEVKQVRKQYEKNKQEQARKVMELYKKHNVNPFSGILLLFIQLPIIFALYWVFYRGGLPELNIEILYSFIPRPENINMLFLGIIDMAGRSFPIALLAGVTQYFQIKLSLPPQKPRGEGATLQEDFARSFQMQMRYFLPLFVIGFSYFISSAIALYWLTSNMFAIGQELVIRREFKRE